MPEYTRRTGSRNLASEYYFPKTWNPPDLGPKMYNALPALDFLESEAVDTCGNDNGDGGGQDEEEAEEGPRVIGTTNLHLDLTDAVNILLYADSTDPCPYDTTATLSVPACGAIWDIFPPSASASIRSYLRKTRPLTCSTIPDPIHLQLFYLSAQDLLRLSKPPYNVHSYRIFQNPGEAVFIPAGCAHQVRNRKASVKVAVDFLSPESVQRGVQTELAEELRACWKEDMVGRKGGREDVLQLWKCLEFAWRSLRAVEEGKEGERVQSDEVKEEEKEQKQEKEKTEGDELNGAPDTAAPPNEESDETIVVSNRSEQPSS